MNFTRCLALSSLLLLTAQARAADSGYAGAESCQDCHEEQFKTYKKSPHGNALHAKTPAGQHSCESCHGPRAKHVQEMEDKGEVPEGHLETTIDVSLCLECHNDSKLVLWRGSEHQRRDVSCTDCHQVHGNTESLMREKTQSETCATCHKEVRAQLLRASHHPIREGKMECSDCHNPHGTVADKLIAANTVNEKCFECHAEKRGPYLWEHAPVTEDCSTCHTPHGSTYDNLLVSRTPFLCQQCHSNARHPGTLYAQSPQNATQSVYQALNNRGYYRNCLNCHSAVHGSNHPSGKSLSR